MSFAPLSVKSDGDFPDILAAEKPDIWESHRPAEGGVTGKLFRDIIQKAAAIKAKRQARKPAKKRPVRARARARAA